MQKPQIKIPVMQTTAKENFSNMFKNIHKMKNIVVMESKKRLKVFIIANLRL